MGSNPVDGFEGSDVVLGAGLEGDVEEVGGVGEEEVEDVAEHGGVCVDVLGLGGAVDRRDVEEVGDVGEGGEFGLCIGGVGDVALDVMDGVVGGGPGRARGTGNAVDLPGAAGGVAERKDLGTAVADDAGDADDEGDVLGLGQAIVFIKPLLRKEKKSETRN